MENILRSVEASMLDRALSLGRKVAIINSQPFYDGEFQYTCFNWFEYRILSKGSAEICAWETLMFDGEFDYNFKRINGLLNHIIEKNYFPINYVMFYSKTPKPE